ncbi:MAG: hypothetical protein A3C85_04720 [Candidatus Doudnabacteria bacterium RIFCSPHIGHO2_02_FULL_48_21]|uniref:Glycoside hydrolase family 42 N-terminal domain-containing protein n=1 Tax=Candidatus Doudnabacteria bacterium RIFCSPLOWO2_02_FULL_48_13 TaxID=1817845 RepID=A0A1F5Q8A1_9BACT|nr:MAG: hypothetical protein A3K05_01030 [Candidatus Doudnabacteria bacterium RIFCSPHIGHO2_01_48_18]OGE78004.1 MAG: hypothetical protein A2668_01890 [Candidatus Doudnabacteria bacterium RIFCSPHIGHO2_01_FULL_48_180]OGE91041.1 MAG: hypothetical protein A3F44_01810 [Candidatus Doudnabacteria bacterium RIFCSPHIGHO2_12_FULL_47_25]OGE93405.1 MAG: hypothetical protein A3C85_04720 [Candidatus Doudnabacteria bacterium RIFCSPHIGHO2_02_FULL_48_21]OGE97417.1 MAG: hypothetical protein A3A83_01840 [Candidatu
MKKFVKILFLIILVLICAAIYFDWQYENAPAPQWGLNFSTTKPAYLGLDWQKMYHEILSDLKPQRLRVMAYWEVIEPRPGEFNFADIDYILTEAGKRDIKVILTLGHKQPGWPECHHPEWYDKLPEEQRKQAILKVIEDSVKHFRQFKSIAAWQVENEPFFVFGPDCPPTSKEMLAREVALVKSLDSRPILLTDSGEKGWWLPTAKYGADIFGSTMYRNIYHHKRQKYVEYFVPPIWYRIKGGMLRELLGVRKVIGVELQAEPWFDSDVFTMPWSRQKELMNGDILSAYAEYAAKAGFAEDYFWGVEWWYYAKHVKGDDELWQVAKRILSQ